MGLEPMTSCVTGRRSNLAELTHQKSLYMNSTFFVAEIAVREGFEPPDREAYSFQDCRICPLCHLTKNYIFV